MRVKDLPTHIRPRERAWNESVSVLSDAELVAILLRSGRKDMNALDLAQAILSRVHGNLRELGSLSPHEHVQINLGRVQAITLCAALELGSRLSRTHEEPKTLEDAITWVSSRIREQNDESMYLISLNARNQCIIPPTCVSVGTRSSVLVQPAHVLRLALRAGASRIVLMHNHPSQNPSPSAQDILLTKQILESCAWVELALVDHIIVTRDREYRFRDEGILDSP